MNVLALCAGIGGLELGVHAACPSARVVGYIERDPDAVSVLRARIGDGQLDDAPIWDDVRTFDGAPWRGCVDLVTAGYPCQPESTAGQRRGANDERWLWADIWRCVRDVEPRYLFLENVAAHLTGTFGRVLGDLAASGWRVEWDCVPAAAVGAPHLRDRVFALAAQGVAGGPTADAGAGDPRQQPESLTRGSRATEPANAGRVGTDSDPMPERQPSQRKRGIQYDQRPPRRPDAVGLRCRPAWWTRTPPPQPALRGVDARVSRRLDGLSARRRLALLGNAVVPQAAAEAFAILWRRMTP